MNNNNNNNNGNGNSEKKSLQFPFLAKTNIIALLQYKPTTTYLPVCLFKAL